MIWIQTICSKRSQLGREGRKECNGKAEKNITGRQCLCCNKNRNKNCWQQWNKAWKDKEHLSTAKRGNNFQVYKNTTHCQQKKKKKRRRRRRRRKNSKKKTSNSTTPPSPDNLDNDTSPTLWDLLQLYLIITSLFSVTYTAGTLGFYKDIIKVNLALGMSIT